MRLDVVPSPRGHRHDRPAAIFRRIAARVGPGVCDCARATLAACARLRHTLAGDEATRGSRPTRRSPRESWRSALVLVGLALGAAPAWGQIAFVQATPQMDDALGATVTSSAFPVAPTLGNSIIVVAWTWSGSTSAAIPTATDNYGNTYTIVTQGETPEDGNGWWGAADLRIDIYCAGGHGGQNVNKVATAVRITHIPSGIVAVCQDERSQLKNKNKAMAVVRSRLLDQEIRKQEEEISADRRSQAGTGERSEKIRTYNFPQGRVSDHRIGLTVHNLEAILEGDLDQIIDALSADEQSKLLGEK